MAWTWPVTSARTGKVVHDDLPLVVDSFSDQLGVAQGGLSATLPLEGFDVDDVLGPERRLIWACWAGQPVAGPYLVAGHDTITETSTDVKVSAPRFDVDLLGRREIQSTLVFNQQDILNITRNVLGYAIGITPGVLVMDPYWLAQVQALPAAGLPWLRFSAGLSGVLIDINDDDAGLMAGNHAHITDAVTMLSNHPAGGFEYRVRPGIDDLGLFATIDLSTGRTFDQPTVVLDLEFPGSILGFTYGMNADDTATSWRAYSSAAGTEKQAGPTVYDVVAHQQEWPLLMGSEQSPLVGDTALAAQAAHSLAAHAGVAETFTFRCGIDDAHPVFLDYTLGSRVRVKIVDHPRWPYGKEGTFRVIGHTITPDKPGTPGSVGLTVLEV